MMFDDRLAAVFKAVTLLGYTCLVIAGISVVFNELNLRYYDN